MPCLLSSFLSSRGALFLVINSSPSFFLSSRLQCRLRSIFIQERRSADKADGPEDFQAAMAMGHSVKAWTKFYDKHYQRRECQAGIDTMNEWRRQLLVKDRADLQTPDVNGNEDESDDEEEDYDEEDDYDVEIDIIHENV